MNDCEVCHKEPSVGVGAMPGVPASFAYGRKCLEANAHPYDMVVINTAMLGGLDDVAQWWVDIVDSTCAHLGISKVRFDDDVRTAIEDMEKR